MYSIDRTSMYRKDLKTIAYNKKLVHNENYYRKNNEIVLLVNPKPENTPKSFVL